LGNAECGFRNWHKRRLLGRGILSLGFDRADKRIWNVDCRIIRMRNVECGFGNAECGMGMESLRVAGYGVRVKSFAVRRRPKAGVANLEL